MNGDQGESAKPDLKMLLASKAAEIVAKNRETQIIKENEEIQSGNQKVQELEENRDSLGKAISGLNTDRGEVKNDLTEAKKQRGELKKTYKEALDDEHQSKVLEEMGIKSFREFLETFRGQSDEVDKYLEAKKGVMEKYLGYLKKRDEVGESFGIDKNDPRRTEDVLGKKRQGLTDEISKARAEVTESQGRANERVLKEASTKLEQLFNRREADGMLPIRPLRWERGLQTYEKAGLGELVVMEAGLLSEEAKTLGMEEGELWKQLYLEKLNNFISTKGKEPGKDIYAPGFKYRVEMAIDYGLADLEISKLYKETDLKTVQEQRGKEDGVLKKFNETQHRVYSGFKLVVEDGKLTVMNDLDGINGQINSWKTEEERMKSTKAEAEAFIKRTGIFSKREDKEQAEAYKGKLSGYESEANRCQEQQQRLEKEKEQIIEKNKGSIEEMQKVIDSMASELGLTPEETEQLVQELEGNSEKYHNGTNYGSFMNDTHKKIDLRSLIMTVPSIQQKHRNSEEVIKQYNDLVNKRESIRNRAR
jgi:hypothetical protein